MTYPWQSTYAAFNNNPIVFTDIDGLFGKRKEAKKFKKDNNLKGRIRKGSDGTFDFTEKGSGHKFQFGSFTGETFTKSEKKFSPNTQSKIGELFASIDKLLSGGIQVYGDATNSDNSLARKGNKNDPFNGSIDLSDLELLGSRFKKLPKSARAAAKAKFDNDYKGIEGRQKKLIDRVRKVFTEGDVKAGTERTADNGHGNPAMQQKVAKKTQESIWKDTIPDSENKGKFKARFNRLDGQGIDTTKYSFDR